jgi:hypothetical protein
VARKPPRRCGFYLEFGAVRAGEETIILGLVNIDIRSPWRSGKPSRRKKKKEKAGEA